MPSQNKPRQAKTKAKTKAEPKTRAKAASKTKAKAKAKAAPRRLGRGLASLMADTRAEPQMPPETAPQADSVEQPSAKQAPAGRYVPTPPIPITPATPTIAREPDPQASHEPLEVQLGKIRPNPYQPRTEFNEAELAELAQSIRQQGILQPLLVAPEDAGTAQGPYILVAGERRLRAAGLAGLDTVPCVIRSATPEQLLEWALIENIQRKNLNPIERAIAYRQYMDRFASTQQELAEKLGLPRSTVANLLRLLDLTAETQGFISQGGLTFGHAKVLAALADMPARQTALARKVVETGMSVRHLEQLVASSVDKPVTAVERPDQARSARDQYLTDVQRQLSHALGAKVAIRPGRGKHTGRIVVSYHGLDDFDRITEALGVKLES